MNPETFCTALFFATLIPSFAIWLWLFQDWPRLISHRYYSYSTGLFIIISVVLFITYLIAPWVMAISAGILIGMWGSIIYLSYKIKKEENERKWNRTL